MICVATMYGLNKSVLTTHKRLKKLSAISKGLELSVFLLNFKSCK